MLSLPLEEVSYLRSLADQVGLQSVRAFRLRNLGWPSRAVAQALVVPESTLTLRINNLSPAQRRIPIPHDHPLPQLPTLTSNEVTYLRQLHAVAKTARAQSPSNSQAANAAREMDAYLLAAYRRDVTVASMANDLGISYQALKKRVNRASRLASA